MIQYPPDVVGFAGLKSSATGMIEPLVLVPLMLEGRIGFHGVTPVAQATHPTTLADVIAILTNKGLCA